MRVPLRASFAIAAGVACLSFTAVASADGNVIVTQQPGAPPPPQPGPVVVQAQPAYAPPPYAEGRPEWVGPNRRLLVSGIVLFGGLYGASAVVAGESNHQGDNNLYAPLVGPCDDLADRGHCAGDCTGETGNRILLVLDGIFQAVGVVSIISAFAAPETRVTTVTTTAKAEKPKVYVTPTTYAHGTPGLAVIGSF